MREVERGQVGALAEHAKHLQGKNSRTFTTKLNTGGGGGGGGT